MQLIFEASRPGRKGYSLPDREVPEVTIAPEFRRKTPAQLPEVTEPELMRHFVNLSRLNHHVDKDFYPLGSCTMKYNPKVNEELCRHPGFAALHPLQPAGSIQGALALMHELGEMLRKLVNLDAITLQPAAGAHGEFSAISMFKAYFNQRQEPRKYILIPDSAHGTNPASVNFSGFKPMTIASDAAGLIDLAKLDAVMTNEVAGIMLTNPNTLGLFEKNVRKIADLVHSRGGLVYLDGANLNALLGLVRPGDLGFDAVHFNLHKTFSTPHGGGGPGAGPVAVRALLEPFLPVPVVKERSGTYHLDYNRPDSIGKVQSFYGNFLVLVRAYVFLRIIGETGVHEISRGAILNANYVVHSLKKDYVLPYDTFCMHEGVLSGKDLKAFGVKTLDVAKRLLDYGMHAPTVYFPLIVSEALMIEPTENETLETLKRFIDIMKTIRQEAENSPELLKNAPHDTPVRRLDEVKAVKELKIRWKA